MHRTTYPADTSAGRAHDPRATQPRESRIARRPAGQQDRRDDRALYQVTRPPVKAMGPTEITALPEAGRDEQLKRWNVTPERTGALSKRQRRGAVSEEHVDASSNGSLLWVGDGAEEEPDELHEALTGFLQDGGWHAIEPAKGSVRGEGTTSHRGVLHPDEYVDADALRAAVEAELGFTYDDIRSVYRKGRISDSQVALRTLIDSRLLDIAIAGGELMPLAREFGWAIQEAHAGGGATCRTLWRALARAKETRAITPASCPARARKEHT